jgi:WXG100 family type VII secretion target
MADIIQANYQSLTTVAKTFAQQSNEIRQMHGRLNRQVAQLRSSWVGKGSNAFFAEMSEKVLPAVLRLASALAEADKVTKQISEVLQTAEQESASPLESFAAEGSSGGLGAEGSSGGLGAEFNQNLDDFGREVSALGGMSASSFDELSSENGFGDASEFGGESGGMGTGGENEYAVPEDWLSGVQGAGGGSGGGGMGGGGSGGEMGGGSGGGEMGGGSGGGEMGGGSGGGETGGGSGGGETGGGSGSGSGGGETGGGSGSGQTGGGSGGGMPSGAGQGQGTGAGAAGAAEKAAVVPGPLRYAGGSVAAPAAAAGAAGPAGAMSAGGGAARQAAKGADMGLGMGLTALAPLFALMGKAIKDRASGR